MDQSTSASLALSEPINQLPQNKKYPQSSPTVSILRFTNRWLTNCTIPLFIDMNEKFESILTFEAIDSRACSQSLRLDIDSIFFPIKQTFEPSVDLDFQFLHYWLLVFLFAGECFSCWTIWETLAELTTLVETLNCPFGHGDDSCFLFDSPVHPSATTLHEVSTSAITFVCFQTVQDTGIVVYN